MKKLGMTVKEILELCENTGTFDKNATKKQKLAFVKLYKRISRGHIKLWKKCKKDNNLLYCNLNRVI